MEFTPQDKIDYILINFNFKFKKLNICYRSTNTTNKMQLDTCMKKHNTAKKQSIVLPDTEMGDEMTDECMSVGLFCSVIGHTVDF